MLISIGMSSCLLHAHEIQDLKTEVPDRHKGTHFIYKIRMMHSIHFQLLFRYELLAYRDSIGTGGCKEHCNLFEVFMFGIIPPLHSDKKPN